MAPGPGLVLHYFPNPVTALNCSKAPMFELFLLWVAFLDAIFFGKNAHQEKKYDWVAN